MTLGQEIGWNQERLCCQMSLYLFCACHQAVLQRHSQRPPESPRAVGGPVQTVARKEDQGCIAALGCVRGKDKTRFRYHSSRRKIVVGNACHNRKGRSTSDKVHSGRSKGWAEGEVDRAVECCRGLRWRVNVKRGCGSGEGMGDAGGKGRRLVRILEMDIRLAQDRSRSSLRRPDCRRRRGVDVCS